MIWTNEIIGKLTTLWNDGKTGSEIAEILGISRNAVIGKAHRLKLSGRQSPIKKKLDKPSFLALTEKMCRWPFGDPKKSDFHFCGEFAEHAPYCPEHRKIAYVHMHYHPPIVPKPL